MEERARSEVTFRFKIENFVNLKNRMHSPLFYVRNIPWRVLVMPRLASSPERTQKKYMGYFLQCNPDSELSDWFCEATAELRIIPQKPNTEIYLRRTEHVYTSSEHDWGFSEFISWKDVIDPEHGYIQGDVVLFEVYVKAEEPVYVDSTPKKKTVGHIGLENQGTDTCYMNSLLQTLYFTNKFRKLVYKIPTGSENSLRSIALALQGVFYDLQYSNKTVSTKNLIKSFEFETLGSPMPHDAQEFLRVLLDKLENKMRRTCVEGTIPKLFQGKMKSYIKCTNVNVTSTRVETFYDIQLNIMGRKNVEESLKDYICTTRLDGDNKYDAGEYGLQEAVKGAIFSSFPPVLHLHLMRFQYDPITDSSVKLNDRFEFFNDITLDDYLNDEPSDPEIYFLHAVLAHSGDCNEGNYVVFLNPNCKGQWFKFDDDVVSRCTKEEAIQFNYGGSNGYRHRDGTNALMLVYVRAADMKTVFEDVTQVDIPAALRDRLTKEKKGEVKAKKTATAKAKKKLAGPSLQLPECPVCMETMSAPIYQCQSGHSLCNTCTTALNPPICPICRKAMTKSIRNWQLEEIVAKAKIPCPNKQYGCVFTVRALETEEHLKECIFRTMGCPYNAVYGNCSWSGRLKQMMDHFKERHPLHCNVNPDTLIELNNIVITQTVHYFYLVQVQGKMHFIINIKIDAAQKMAYWTIQLIGSKKIAHQHMYEIHVTSKMDERRKFSFIEHCFNELIKADEVMRQGKCAIVPLNLLSNFITERKLSFRFLIYRNPQGNDNDNKQAHEGPRGTGSNINNANS